MAVFGLVSMQQITYHMKVRPPLRTLTTLIPTPVLDVPLGRAVQCVSPEPPRPSPSTVARENLCFLAGSTLHDRAFITELGLLRSTSGAEPWRREVDGRSTEVRRPCAPQSIDQGFSKLSLTESMPIYEHIASIYSRASVLLRDSMDLDGVAFLDAYPTAFALSEFCKANNLRHADKLNEMI